VTRRVRIVVHSDPAAVAFARDRIMTTVDDWRVPLTGEQRDAVKLVASKLTTNAVVHTFAGEPDFITVWLHVNNRRLRMEVYDGCGNEPQLQEVAPGDEKSRGLVLVDALADRYGWDPTGRGKRVWAEFDIPVRSPATRAELLRSRIKAAMPYAYPLRGAAR
jgi:anti-sigma regulatory factor (Ser/Thr protein kinase)